MVPLKSLRGRPKSQNEKQLVSVRYSRDVIEYFRSTGAGWQARMDEVLRKHVAQRRKESKGANDSQQERPPRWVNGVLMVMPEAENRSDPQDFPSPWLGP